MVQKNTVSSTFIYFIYVQKSSSAFWVLLQVPSHMEKK